MNKFKQSEYYKKKKWMILALIGFYTLTISKAAIAENTTPEVSQAPVYSDIPQPLRQLLCSTRPQKEHAYIDRILKYMKNGRNPDQLDQEDINIFRNTNLTTRRAMQVSRIISADLNADGKVSKNEVQNKFRQAHTKEFLTSNNIDPENEINDLMSFDLNKDEIIDYDEMRQVDTHFTGGGEEHLRSLLQLAPDKKLLTKEVLETKARTAFAVVDLNRDTILSGEECVPYLDALRKVSPRKKSNNPSGIVINQDAVNRLNLKKESK